MEGRVSSVQSMGAVDGPGLRYVVFLQGCPLRCAYCHNPETWDLTGGTPYTAEDLCKTILRYRPYFGENGGVTVSGGEPLLQPEFVAELFRRLHEHNIHTALDTAGAGDLSRAKQVLKHTDLVLCDIKFPTEAQYKSPLRRLLAAHDRFHAPYGIDAYSPLGAPRRRARSFRYG